MTFEGIRQKAQAAWQEFAAKDRRRILIGDGTCGRAAGAGEVLAAVRAHLDRAGIEAAVCKVGCLGACYAEPLVELSAPATPAVLYGPLDPEQVPDLLSDYFRKGDLRADLALAVMDGDSQGGIPAFADLPMMQGQVRIVLRNCGAIDPENINHYIARGGYGGLARAVSMTPEQVIEEVKASGLRGRGGVGFPTGRKMELVHAQRDAPKWVVANAEEGEPGTFKDRVLMESDPHGLLEGMLIAGYAAGASRGVVFVQPNYPVCAQLLRTAVAQAGEIGLCGQRILGSDYSFHVEVCTGAGGYVTGEETALLEHFEGRRGIPRVRPPFPAQTGLGDKPTLVNNVETLANVPPILRKGAEWYRQQGTESSPGTKLFCLSGQLVRPGTVEFPLGVSIAKVVFEAGGGVPEGRSFRAALIGGPTGGYVPQKHLDLPLDFESLAQADAMMGSGAIVVADESCCIVDSALHMVRFLADECCGKCVPGRLGTQQMVRIMENVVAGSARLEDLELLKSIAGTLTLSALCGLGQAAGNPVVSSLRHFRDEYEAHILHKKCPAIVCRRIVGAPCKHTCPAGVDVPRCIRYTAAGRYRDALDVIREKLPLPSICGWVCFHPCEVKCRRLELDDAIAVRALSRFVAEKGAGRRRKRLPRPEPTGKRVAVVGSGPAGLTAAYYLARRGHKVTVFEKAAEAGGTLRTRIPAFRLPREVIDAEIKEIRKAGVRIRTGSAVDSVSKLLKRGYDAVLLAFGAGGGLKMGIPGEDDPQVFDCIEFLRRANEGADVHLEDRVAVIGGGSSAMDAARMALRLGAGQVSVVYRRTRAQIPAAAEEVEEAAAEGVKLQVLAAPVAVWRTDGELSLRCIRMELGPVDDSGRPRPLPIEGSEFDVALDSVIMAIGQLPERLPDVGCEVDGGGRVRAEQATLQTSRPGVFAAGDVVTGPASVIEAIAAGRRAASSIDRYLGGDGNIDEVLAPAEEPGTYEALEEQEELPRVQIPRRPAAERVRDLQQVELTLTEEAALAEAGRCLRCDLEELED